MNNMDDKFSVALTKCFYCLEDNEIILNRRLTKHVADQVKEMDGKVVSMNPCPKCEEHMKQGVILLTFDPHKSDHDWDNPGKGKIPNPYRTGGFFVIKDDALKRAVNEPELVDLALKYRWMFIEHEVGVAWGLFELASQSK